VSQTPDITMDDSPFDTVAQRTSTTLPNWCSFSLAELPPEMPGTAILIHGVNDLGTDFGTVEAGLCEGLNERLNRSDLKAGVYTQGRMANEDRKVTKDDLFKDMDGVLYRRSEPDGTRSVLIPFYWGYRAAPDEIGKQSINGQVVDIHGNRLDKNFAKNGGMFANATTNIPDMFNTHFKGGLKTNMLEKLQHDPTHPLLEAPNRHYMVLAARRLAMLVKQIRNIDPDETVSIIAHSQGTVISLLAQALLMQADSSDGSSAAANRPADTLVLIDSPYSVIAPWMDRATQTGDEQQTAYARARTLIELVKLVGDGKHPTPELDQLLPNTADCRGRAGPAWTPTQAKRFNPKTDDANKAVVFAERDNRGKVYLYFCPEDATVALKTVQGIGTNGVPDTAAVHDPDAGKTVDMPLMTPLIASGFHQRVFTRRKRNGATVKVGTAPQVYTLREKGETSHGTTGFINTQIKQGGNSVGATRQVNGEELNPPFDPDLQGNVIPGTENKPIDANETAPGKQSWDQMETEVALTRLKLQTLTDQPLPWPGAGVDPSKPSVAEVQAQYDANPDPDDRCQVFDVTAGSPVAPDVRYVTRTETPNEAKVRLMNDPKRLGDSSYHSAIMSGQKNHRYGTAMDVAIGQGKALDDLEWGTLLRFIADWRTPLGMISVKCRAKYPQLIPGMRALVEATCEYYTSGAFPTDLVPEKPPKPVVSETLTMQNQVSREATRTPANTSGGTI